MATDHPLFENCALSNFPLSFPSLHHSYYSKFNSKYTLFSFLCSKEKKLKKNLPRCYILSIIFTMHNYKKKNCQILPREYFLNLHNKTRKSRKETKDRKGASCIHRSGRRRWDGLFKGGQRVAGEKRKENARVHFYR